MGTDVYLLRLVLRDWSDKYSKMIAKPMAPELEPGAKVLVNDRIIPGLGEARYKVSQ